MSSDGGARGRVLVLKERTISDEHGGQRDPYEAALKDAGFSPYFLPVLSHRLVNLESIAGIIAARCESCSTAQEGKDIDSDTDEKIRRSKASHFAGVIFTSQRAVAAWADAGQAVLEKCTNAQYTWNSIPFYAVGPATASALLRLDARLRPPRDLILGAEESGSAERLASYITSRTCASPLLYLVGDKRKDTLPSSLKQHGIMLQEVQAYETFQSTTFEADYADLQKHAPFQWIIFFSPSGAKMLLPLLDLNALDHVPRLAAIGPTTRDYLESQEGVGVTAMSASPTPQSLVKAILAVDGR